MSDYTSKAIISSIRYTSRASVKIKDNFYTVEATEERIIPDVEDIDIAKEKEFLWDSVNAECDEQIQQIISTFK